MRAHAHNQQEDGERSWPFTIGVTLSLLLHAGAAVWFVSAGAAQGNPDAMSDQELFHPPQMDIIELGEPESDATSITWIGYTEYEEHLAQKAETEQALSTLATSSSAPTREPGLDAPASSQPVPAAQPVAIPVAQLMPAEDQSAPPAGSTVPVLTNVPETREFAEQDIAVAFAEEFDLQEQIGPLPSEIHESNEVPDDELAPAEPEDAAEAPAEQQPAEPTDGADAEIPEMLMPALAPSPDANKTAGTGGGNEGNSDPGVSKLEPSAVPSDREAMATAIKHSELYKPGKPLASSGLRIRTVRPDLSHYNTLFAAYTDPVARIFFARDGHVIDVVFLRDTGHADVDRNTLDALYQWRAEGELLGTLSKSPERAGKNRLVRGNDLAVGVFKRNGVETLAVDILLIYR